MNVLSHSEAKKAIAASLFQPDAFGTLVGCPTERLGLGKYQSTIIGRDISAKAPKNIRLVWAVKRKDRHGEYFALFCIPAPLLKVTTEIIAKAREAGYTAAVEQRPRAPAACKTYEGLIKGFAVGEGGDVLAIHWLAGYQAHCDERAELIIQRTD